MKKIIYILLFLISYTAYSQSLSIFNIDASNFRTIKANFFAFDSTGKQITNLNPSDFEVNENGMPRIVTSVSCPEPKPIQKVSIAMSIDVSGSMRSGLSGEIPVELGKTTARELCKSVTMPPSEFALQTCDSKALIIQDFTTDKAKLLSKIDPITAQGDNDFVEHLMNRLTGLLNIAKNGQYKRAAVLYTDAWWYALTDYELQACKDTCSKYNIQFYAVIYSRPESEPTGIKKSLQLLADATGGYLYDGVTTTEAAEGIANCLQLQAQGGDPCSINWTSDVSCISELINVEAKLSTNNLSALLAYIYPNNAVAKLEFNPKCLIIKKAIPGIMKDTTITVTALNEDFNVTNIISSNPAYLISPISFFLPSGQSRELHISYLSVDSGYTSTKFTLINDQCETKYLVSGGYPGKKAKIQTLKILHPNGGESFVVGIDTVITWEGVLPEEKVKLEYTTDNGTNWIVVADSASGLSYNWKIPKTPSNTCLARVVGKLGYDIIGCLGGEVHIGNQIWMGCNLDVDHYRNGDSIPELRDKSEWFKTSTGAWCYYNNDPNNGIIYGKLYNWYALNDPRGLAPEGWHIPSDDEWKEMEMSLGMSQTDADKSGWRGQVSGKLKATGTLETGDGLWYNHNYEATNETGFSAIPGGYRDWGPTVFEKLGTLCRFWTNSEVNVCGWTREISFDHIFIIRESQFKGCGFSVRCIKD